MLDVVKAGKQSHGLSLLSFAIPLVASSNPWYAISASIGMSGPYQDFFSADDDHDDLRWR